MIEHVHTQIHFLHFLRSTRPQPILVLSSGWHFQCLYWINLNELCTKESFSSELTFSQDSCHYINNTAPLIITAALIQDLGYKLQPHCYRDSWRIKNKSVKNVQKILPDWFKELLQQSCLISHFRLEKWEDMERKRSKMEIIIKTSVSFSHLRDIRCLTLSLSVQSVLNTSGCFSFASLIEQIWCKIVAILLDEMMCHGKPLIILKIVLYFTVPKSCHNNDIAIKDLYDSSTEHD